MSENRKQNPSMGHGPMRGMGLVEKPKDFKGTLKKLLSYVKPYQLAFVFILLFAIISTVLNIIAPKIMGNATTEVVKGLVAKYTTQQPVDFTNLKHILTTLIFIYVCATLFSYIQGWLLSSISQKITYQLRKDISLKINRLPLRYYDGQTHGEVLSRVTNDVDTISQSLTQSLQQVVTSVISVIGIIIMMFTISWKLTIMALLVIPASAVVATTVVKHSQKYFQKQQTTLGNVNGHIEEMYGGHIIVKAFNGEDDSKALFAKYNQALYESAYKSQFISGIMMPLTQLIGNIGYVGVCVFGGYLAIHDGLTIGDIQAFIQYVRNFNQPITQTAQIANILQSTVAAAERVFTFLEQEEEIKEIETVDASNIQGEVVFENVGFGYEEGKQIIHNFSAMIKPGQQVAIVGPTGAGKTTIVKLLMRFYDINQGNIYIDGINTKDLTRQQVRDCFGMVLQDAWLHEGNIMENIRYGNLEASDADVIQAAKNAYVHHFIRTLEDGYQTNINEESTNISQGQKQLLTIARAFLKNPKILILDEATSSVDTRTEVLIQKGMENLMKGRTSFVIAHRLSTIKNADLILVMNHGDIVEVGNHEELLVKNGFYANLYNAQFDEAMA